MPTVVPAGTSRSKWLQQGLAAGVGEVDPLEADVAAHRGEGKGPVAAGDGDRGVQQVHHPVGGGHGPLVVVEGAAQGGEGPEQALGDEHQEAVGADGDRALPGLQTADHQDRQEGEQDREADQGNEGRRQADGPAVAGPVGLTLLDQPLLFPVLGRVALDGEHAAQVVAQPAGQIPGPLTHLPVAGRKPALKAERPPEDHGDRQEGDPRHRRGEHQHGSAHRHHGGDQLKDLVGPVVEEALQLVDVVVEDGEQPAAAAGLEEGHLQVLEMVVGLDAQFVLDRLGQVAPEEGIEVLEEGFGAPDQEREHRQHAQLPRHGGEAQSRQPGGALLHHHIHRQADQDGRGQVEEFVEDGAAGRHPDQPAVGPQAGQEASQPRRCGGLRAVGLNGHGRRGTHQRLPPPPPP